MVKEEGKQAAQVRALARVMQEERLLSLTASFDGEGCIIQVEMHASPGARFDTDERSALALLLEARENPDVLRSTDPEDLQRRLRQLEANDNYGSSE